MAEAERTPIANFIDPELGQDRLRKTLYELNRLVFETALGSPPPLPDHVKAYTTWAWDIKHGDSSLRIIAKEALGGLPEINPDRLNVKSSGTEFEVVDNFNLVPKKGRKPEEFSTIQEGFGLFMGRVIMPTSIVAEHFIHIEGPGRHIWAIESATDPVSSVPRTDYQLIIETGIKNKRSYGLNFWSRLTPAQITNLQYYDNGAEDSSTAHIITSSRVEDIRGIVDSELADLL
jgi:hypothetical protein